MLTASRLFLLGCFHLIFPPCSAFSLRRNHLEHALLQRADSWNRSSRVEQIKQPEVSRTKIETSSNAEPLSTSRTEHRLPGTTTANTTSIGYIPRFDEICALWDSSCIGSEQSAFDVLLDSLFWEEGHFCDTKSLDALYKSLGETLPYQRVRYSTCTPGLSDAPQASKSAVRQLMEFARSPKCTSMLSEKDCTGKLQTDTDWCTRREAESVCAGSCAFRQAIVELLYWPLEGSDTSCLSIVGDNYERDSNATVYPDGYVGWGCSTLSTAQNGQINSGYLMTATQTYNGRFTYKQELLNPWNTTIPCVSSFSRSPETQTLPTDAPALKVRAHAIVNTTQLSMKQNNTSLRVAVSNGFTFTSPSFYMKLVELSVADNAGDVGPKSDFPILAFTPGELSSFYGNGRGSRERARVFNFADLPCPPMSVMRENWYKPAPGHPYQPRIAFPSRIKAMYSSWQTCNADLDWFTAWDPPQSLTPASRMAPDITAEPLPTSSLALDTVASSQRTYTSRSNKATAAPVATLDPDLPRKTTAPSKPQSSVNASPPGLDLSPNPGVFPSPGPNTHSDPNLPTISKESGFPPGVETPSATASASSKPAPQPANPRTHISGSRRGAAEDESSNINRQSSVPAVGLPDQGARKSALPGNPVSLQAADPLSQPQESAIQGESHTSIPSVGAFDLHSQDGTVGEMTRSMQEQSPSLGSHSSFAAAGVAPKLSSVGPDPSPTTISPKPHPAETDQGSERQSIEPAVTVGPVSQEPPSRVSQTLSDSNLQEPLATAGEPALGFLISAALESGPNHKTSVPFTSALFASTRSPAEAQGSVRIPPPSSIDTTSIPASDRPMATSDPQSETLSIPSRATQDFSGDTAASHDTTSPLAITIGSKAITFQLPASSVEATLVHSDSPALVVESDTRSVSNTGEHDSVIATIGSSPVTARPHGVLIDGTTLTPEGSALTVSGTLVSLAPTALIIGTHVLPFSRSSDGSGIATVGSDTVIAQSHGVLVGSSTLIVDGPAFTISGTEISLQSTALILGTRTISLPATSRGNVAIATVGTEVITARPHRVVVAGSTLTPDGPAVTISGVDISLDSTALVIGSSTIAVPTASSKASPVPTMLSGKQTIAVPSGDIVVDGLTLRPGSTGVTVSGMTMSLNSNSKVVIGLETAPSYPRNGSTTDRDNQSSQSGVPTTKESPSSFQTISNSSTLVLPSSTVMSGLILVMMAVLAICA